MSRSPAGVWHYWKIDRSEYKKIVEKRDKNLLIVPRQIPQILRVILFLLVVSYKTEVVVHIFHSQLRFLCLDFALNFENFLWNPSSVLPRNGLLLFYWFPKGVCYRKPTNLPYRVAVLCSLSQRIRLSREVTCEAAVYPYDRAMYLSVYWNLDKNSSILITFIGRSQMMGSSKSTVIISCINVPILFFISPKYLVCLYGGNNMNWNNYIAKADQ